MTGHRSEALLRLYADPCLKLCAVAHGERHLYQTAAARRSCISLKMQRNRPSMIVVGCQCAEIRELVPGFGNRREDSRTESHESPHQSSMSKCCDNGVGALDESGHPQKGTQKKGEGARVGTPSLSAEPAC